MEVWIIVPGCVRILYPVACEAAQISTESGSAGPCPAARACPGIRNPAYCPRMGRGVSRLPCGVCRGIRKPTLRLPDRQGSLPTAAWRMPWHTLRGTFEPPARLASQPVRADSWHILLPPENGGMRIRNCDTTGRTTPHTRFRTHILANNPQQRRYYRRPGNARDHLPCVGNACR